MKQTDFQTSRLSTSQINLKVPNCTALDNAYCAEKNHLNPHKIWPEIMGCGCELWSSQWLCVCVCYCRGWRYRVGFLPNHYSPVRPQSFDNQMTYAQPLTHVNNLCRWWTCNAVSWGSGSSISGSIKGIMSYWNKEGGIWENRQSPLDVFFYIFFQGKYLRRLLNYFIFQLAQTLF